MLAPLLPPTMMMKTRLLVHGYCHSPSRVIREVAAAAARTGSAAPKPSSSLTKNRGAAKKPKVSRLAARCPAGGATPPPSHVAAPYYPPCSSHASERCQSSLGAYMCCTLLTSAAP